MIEKTLEATLDNVPVVQEVIDQFLEEHDCSMKSQMQIDIAVEELFVNIASYAYAPETGDATVRVELTEDGSSVRITLIDHGVPYDPLAKEDPDVTLGAEQRKIGGLGIFMVKKSMDLMDYEYRDGQNVVRIEKTL